MTRKIRRRRLRSLAYRIARPFGLTYIPTEDRGLLKFYRSYTKGMPPIPLEFVARFHISLKDGRTISIIRRSPLLLSTDAPCDFFEIGVLYEDDHKQIDTFAGPFKDMLKLGRLLASGLQVSDLEVGFVEV